jgi:hypothetical protein
MRYKENGGAGMTENPLVRAHDVGASCSEPATEHGPGIVGDSGERRKPHPV